MFSEERREQIVALLNKNKKVYVKELAERFHLSMDSIRRDLTILEERGLLRKTHGGAMLPPVLKPGVTRQVHMPGNRWNRLWSMPQVCFVTKK
ncbi:DeoR family transcriptional regulator [Paenibacillus larvae]|uniref:DeoR family transcriptional regulator n=1 Tax=Paenibacillus larvae TaxID=1464 RepID=UPI00289256C9|nr:DeoR family transcriptional regulator [Paenibacillus larvae]MDT2192346.1 DeoR family transcriptional regulator [Paenibacillus larvae]